MSDILRRGRLESVPDEEIMEYTTSLKADRWIFDADILVDFAHTVMLTEQGIIKQSDSGSILKGLLQVREEGIDRLDHSYEDIHIALEARLIDLVGEDVGGRMHSGRSRNDEVATCIRLRLREELLGMMEELVHIRAVLLELAGKHRETLMPGYTHLQHAQPTTMAHHMMAHQQALGRDLERAIDCFARVNRSPLGAAAFASTGFSINRERTRELLAFNEIIENSMDAVSSRDFLIETASVISCIMINLTRIAEELVVWSSTEFSFIELSDQYASTSSIMPQKKNPDTAELLRGKSGVATGSLIALLTICKGLPLSYNRDLQEATPHIWNSVLTCRASLRVAAGMLASMKINEDILAEQSTTGFTTATELADTLVRECDIPFRTAHQIVGQLARMENEPDISDIETAGKDILGESLIKRGLTEQMVKEALDPMLNIKRRNNIGGPNPEEIGNSIARVREQLLVEERKVAKISENIDDALANLMKSVNEFTKDN
ncbi:argininosuccinate lyase [Methanohalophilus levihalophilus]|uniref:argininosuccinate lyase n=1 Tax=Methanohalophilus levihalophilus TaxID=1431282 RepID=UPI001AE76714|nr:argininosuccinate lyase [Methanohalophilus levihalophilus]MBP2029186.1 argininosuccinate lyase [Methanohalophilus levihalophilus]